MSKAFGRAGAVLTPGHTALVMEYVPYGTLHRNLHHEDTAEGLQWHQRGRKVAIDVARGLVYLHSRKASCSPSGQVVSWHGGPALWA